MRRPTADPTSRVVLATGVLAAVLAVGLGAALHGHVGDTRLDVALGTPVIRLFARHRATVVGLANLGGPETIALLAVLLAAVLGARGRWTGAAAVVLAPAVTGLLTQYVLKPVVDRPLNTEPSWPSGHAGGTWALATVVVVLLLREGCTRVRVVDSAAVLVVAVVNAVGLVGAQYHFTTDVLGGAAVGVAAGCATCLALRVAR